MFPYSRSASAGVSNIVDCGPNRLQLLTLGSLHNDDDYGNKNVKKAVGLDKQTTTLHVHHAFLYISLPSLHDCNVKLPKNFVEDGNKRQQLSFSFPEL